LLNERIFWAGSAPPSAEPVLETAALLLEPPSAGSLERRVEAVSNGDLRRRARAAGIRR